MSRPCSRPGKIAVALCLTLALAAPCRAEEAPALRIGTTTAPPFAMHGADGAWIGLLADIECGSATGIHQKSPGICRLRETLFEHSLRERRSAYIAQAHKKHTGFAHGHGKISWSSRRPV